MNILDPTLLTASNVITGFIFALAAYFTRANRRRIAGALIAAIPIIPFLVIVDTLAARMGWWYYPAVGSGNAPLAWYISAALGYGAALGLVGWRIIRRWRVPGLIGFIGGFALFGLARDTIYSATTQFIIFGTGAVPLVADFLAYACAALGVQLLMHWIVGPTNSDDLARSRNGVK